MSHWKWVEDLARNGVSVEVRYSKTKGAWEVMIGGHLRSSGKQTAAEAISEAVQSMCIHGAKAVYELDVYRARLANLAKDAA